VYEVYLERAVERDLTKLPAETFYRIIPVRPKAAQSPIDFRPLHPRQIVAAD